LLRLVLEEYLALGRMRESIAHQAEIVLASNPDRRRLITVLGVGPLTALRFWPRLATCGASPTIASS
jgi:hypothetical protein